MAETEHDNKTEQKTETAQEVKAEQKTEAEQEVKAEHENAGEVAGVVSHAGNLKHASRGKQVGIFLGKMFRMFIYQRDWKLLPMAAIIAGAVALVAGDNMFKTMEGTMTGALALTCVCLWNGFFNSIQVVCRERSIIKREHRAGLHISAYIIAHVIYQSFLCILQTVIIILICGFAGFDFPTAGVITPWFLVDFGITLFLTTFAADMLSLLISSFVKTTTSAMTVMPFLLIFELMFSGAIFTLTGPMVKVENLTATKWGMDCLCAEADYNSQPMVSAWNQLYAMRRVTLNFDIEGIEIKDAQPVKTITDYMMKNHLVNDFLAETGKAAQKAEYVNTVENVSTCWLALLAMSALFIIVSIIGLEFVDHDKR